MFKKYVLLSLMLSAASSLTAGFESTVFSQDTSDPDHPNRLHYNLSGSDKEGHPWEAHEVKDNDKPAHVKLFSNTEAMALYDNGQPKNAEYVDKIFSVYIPRSLTAHPHSGMTIFYQDEIMPIQQPIGFAATGGFGGPGVSELSIAFLPQLEGGDSRLWGKGIASSVVREVVETWAPEVRRIGEGRGLQESDIPIHKAFLSAFGDKVLFRMDATASPENIGSWKVLTQNYFAPARSGVDEGQDVLFDLREMGTKHESTTQGIVKLFDINDQYVKGKRYPIIDLDGHLKVFSYKIQEIEKGGEKVEIPVVKYHFEYWIR